MTCSATAAMVSSSPRSRPFVNVGEQQVEPAQVAEDLDVVGRVAHASTDRADVVDAHHGVVAGVALADVVEERADDEQVGSVDPTCERGGLHRGLHEVPWPTVSGGRRCAGVSSAPGPTRTQSYEEALLVECLDHGDRRRAGEEQPCEQLAGLRRPRLGEPATPTRRGATTSAAR